MDRWSTDEFDISVWSHATFDPPILQNAYNKVGLQTPIHYRWNRDIRTLCELSGVEKTEVKGVAHNALDDCINQAEYIARGIQILNNLWKR